MKNPLRMFHPIFDIHTGGKSRPVFFNVDDICPELRVFDRNANVLKEELAKVLPNKANIPKYHELDPLQTVISAKGDKEKDWKVFLLYAMGQKPKENNDLCPRTAEMLETIPNLFQAFFSILDAGKSIPAHEGPYRGYLRYHIGLKVPKENPPSIRIKDQYYTWQENESMLFDDSWEHEVYNNADEDRVVLIVDILRPMPRALHIFNKLLVGSFGPLYAWKLMRVFQ